MKKLIVLISCVMMMSLSRNAENSNSILLNNTNALEFKIHGRDRSNDNNHSSSFYGTSVTAEFTNRSDDPQKFTFPVGTFLQPDDVTKQRFMVTQTASVTVPANGKKDLHLFAMCTQLHNNGPDVKTQFRIGTLANKELTALAKFIEQNNFQNSAGQNAVWALSDNTSQSSIYDTDTMVTYKLRQFIATIRNEIYLPANSTVTYQARWFKPIKINYKYFIVSPHKITMRLYTIDSRLIQSICEDSVFQKGNYEFNQTIMVPQEDDSHVKALKVIRWVDNTIVQISYFKDVDSTFIRQ